MKTLARLVIALALLLPAAAPAAEKTDVVTVNGWHSKGDALKTEAGVRALKGVARVTTDFAKRQLVITYEDTQIDRARLEKAISEAGYEVAR